MTQDLGTIPGLRAANPLLKPLWGKSSWFGGPNDKTTGPTTASGAPIGDPGIAVNNRSTLGGWWAIKAPNGSIGIVRQTDIGPAASTGRKFDYTYSLLPLFGYSQQDFPTGGQTFGYYLGKNLTDISLNAPQALQSLGATPEQYTAMVHATDVGAVQRGHAAVFDAKGKTATAPGVSSATGSEAVPSNIIPSPNIPDVGGAIVDVWNSLTTPALWKRVLYFIGGAVLLFWGLKELTGAHVPAAIKRGAMVAAA